MSFITTYFRAKFGGIKRLLSIAESALDEKIWLAFILVILWTVLCTIGGILLTPFDFTVSAIKWCTDEDYREFCKEVVETLYSEK